jgi:hypothetical protein
MKINFRKLSFPKGLNLGLLASLLDEEQLEKLIIDSAEKSRAERRVVLPSKTCLKKVVAHFIWSEILAKKLSWPMVKNELMKAGSLKALKLSKAEIERLWLQRKKEIKKEKQ